MAQVANQPIPMFGFFKIAFISASMVSCHSSILDASSKQVGSEANNAKSQDR